MATDSCTHRFAVATDLDLVDPVLTVALRPRTAWSAAMVEAVSQTVLGFPGWTGPEQALRALARFLCLPPLGTREQVRSVTLTLDGTTVCAEGPWAPTSQEPKPWGWVDVVVQTGGVELVRLVLQPGGLLPNHVHSRMTEWELVVDPGVVGWQDGGPEAPLAPGRLRKWRHGQAHGYRGGGAAPAGILCLDAPAFDADDEIFVPRSSPCSAS